MPSHSLQRAVVAERWRSTWIYCAYTRYGIHMRLSAPLLRWRHYDVNENGDMDKDEVCLTELGC